MSKDSLCANSRRKRTTEQTPSLSDSLKGLRCGSQYQVLLVSSRAGLIQRGDSNRYRDGF